MGNVQGADAGQGSVGTRLEVNGRSYRIEKQLGEGGFAYVFKVAEESSGRLYALKRILAGDSETSRIAEQEISIMRSCASKNIITYKGHAVVAKPKKDGHRSPLEYLILMEYCPGGTLTQFLDDKKNSYMTQAQALVIALDVANAVKTLHTQPTPICHRDLKLDNVLYGPDRTWRLCDFGSATTRIKAYETKEEITLEEELIQQYTTPSYRAPEMANLWQRSVVGPKADIWALGCILYALTYLKHPFQAGVHGRLAYPPVADFSDRYLALIRSLLQENPDDRPDINAIVEALSALQRGDKPIKESVVKDSVVKEKKPRKKPIEDEPPPPPKCSADGVADLWSGLRLEDCVPTKTATASRNPPPFNGFEAAMRKEKRPEPPKQDWVQF